MSRDEVAAFFDRYRAAFDTLHGDAVADLWQTPCALMRSENGLRVRHCIAHDENVGAMQGQAD
jgi:hypothetical protein